MERILRANSNSNERVVIRVLAVTFNESRHHLDNPVVSTRSLQVTAWQWDKWEAMERAQRELTGRGGHKLISCPPTHAIQGQVVTLLTTTHAAIIACLCWEVHKSACSHKDSLFLYSLRFESSPRHPQRADEPFSCTTPSRAKAAPPDLTVPPAAGIHRLGSQRLLGFGMLLQLVFSNTHTTARPSS